jgi:predicted histone-like DNA-binding protein
MGIQYRKTKITLNYREEKPQVYKLQQLTYPAVTFAQLVGECSSSCGVNPAQTKAVIDALVNRLVHYMEIGHGVKMGDFGSFKPTFTCKSAPTLEETTIETIKVKKVQFYPGKAFKQMLKDMSVTSASDALSVKDEESEEAENGEVTD